MSEKSPDFTPAPGILPEGMYGPDNFAVTNSQTRQLESADARGFRLIDRSEVPEDVLPQLEQRRVRDENGQIIKVAEQKDIFVGSEGSYKAYTKAEFDAIQAKASEQRQAERDQKYAELPALEETAIVEQLVEQHESPEQALREAKDVFDDRFARIMDDYQQNIEASKGSLKDKLSDLPALQKRAEQSVRGVYETLQQGMNNPSQALVAVHDQLRSGLNALDTATQAVYEGHKAAGIVRGQTEASSGNLSHLGGEFGQIARQIGTGNELDEVVVNEVSADVSARISEQRAVMLKLEQPVTAIAETLNRSLEINTTSHETVRQILFQVEEMSLHARHGRLDMDTYRIATGRLQEVVAGLQSATRYIGEATAVEL